MYSFDLASLSILKTELVFYANKERNLIINHPLGLYGKK